MTTGSRIKAARKKAGMTQKELAEKLKIPYQSIGAWERNERKPKIETLHKIADAIGVTIDVLLDLDPHQNWSDTLMKEGIPVIYGDVPIEEEELFHKVIQASNPDEGRILIAFSRLNPEGQTIAADIVVALAGTPKYRKTPPQAGTQDGEEKGGG